MFWQMVKGALIRQRKRFFLIALTAALGVSLAAAMLNVMFDIGEKVNQELKAYGANITVTPKTASVLQDVYGLEGGRKEYLNEADVAKIKTIFWTNNIARAFGRNHSRGRQECAAHGHVVRPRA